MRQRRPTSEPTQPVRTLPRYRDPFWSLAADVQQLLTDYLDEGQREGAR